MTAVRFTFAATPQGDGRHKVTMHIERDMPDLTDRPRAERAAYQDAADIIEGIIRRRDNLGDDPEKLLQSEPPPPDALAVCGFQIGVRIDKATKRPHYVGAGYSRKLWESKWQPVAQTMMELRDYIMQQLRKHERTAAK